MVQPDAPLIERRVTMLRGCGTYQHARSSANAIECIRLIILDRHAETLVEQLVIERPRPVHIAHSKLDMGDAVELDHLRLVCGCETLCIVDASFSFRVGGSASSSR